MSTEQETAADFDDALARAFAKVERARPDGVDKNIKKDGKDRRYVTLASVDAACREALTSEDFSFPQLVTTEARPDGGLWLLVTTQIRRKGHKIESTLGLPVLGQMISAKDGGGFRPPTAQSVGSAMTYGRRYALSALMGVCPDEDDDGTAASRRDEPEEDPRWARLKAQTNGLANLRDITIAAAQDLVCERAGVKDQPEDRDLPALMDAVGRLLREPEPTPEPAEPKARKGKAAAKPEGPAEPQGIVASRAAFQSAYKAYQEECREQGVTATTWKVIASESIGGKPWPDQPGTDEYLKAAAACETAIDKMRGAA